jgi:hypothetical protein
LRTQALEAYVRLQASLSYVHPVAVKAALELYRPDLVLEILTTKTIRQRDRPHLADVSAMAYALMGNLSAAHDIWDTRVGTHDLAFREFISGRRVAVVGPARPLEDNGPEIDSFDVVVRTQYRPGSNDPQEWYGRRTHVSYYNHHRVGKYLDQVAAGAKSVKWVVLKGSGDEITFRNAVSDYQGGVRTLLAADALFFNAYPMAMQNVLHDLIRFSPKRIKLFSTTFHSSTGAYGGKNYRAEPFKISNQSADLRFHEPFCGYSFIHNLHHAGLCTVDSVTAAALGLGRERYAAVLDDLYGQFTVPL